MLKIKTLKTFIMVGSNHYHAKWNKFNRKAVILCNNLNNFTPATAKSTVSLLNGCLALDPFSLGNHIQGTNHLGPSEAICSSIFKEQLILS